MGIVWEEGNYLGGNILGGSFLGNNCPRAIVQGIIILGNNCPGGIYTRGNGIVLEAKFILMESLKVRQEEKTDTGM